MNTQQAKQDTTINTGIVRFSYLNIFTAKENQDGKLQYSVSLIIRKDDTYTINRVKAAIEGAKQNGIQTLGGKIPTNLKTPLRDGDEDRPDDEAYAGCYFINACAKTRKPGIYVRLPEGGVQSEDDGITEEDVYSGCYGRANINFYAYNGKGGKGIACGLNSVMKYRDGDRLSGVTITPDAFNDDFKYDAPAQKTNATTSDDDDCF